MSAANTRIVLGGLLALVAAAAFWFLVLAPKQRQASELRASIEAGRAELVQTRQQVAQLEVAKQTHDADYASVVRLGKAVPADDDVRSLVVQLDSAAKRSRVDFRAIELNGGAGTATPPPTATGAATAQATTAKLPPGSVVGPAGFLTMPFSFEFTGQFFTLSNFFSRLERLVEVGDERIDVSGRLLTVDAFTLKPGANGFPSVTASIGATAYLIPGDEALPLGTTPRAAAGAASVGSSSSPTPVTATSTGAVR